MPIVARNSRFRMAPRAHPYPFGLPNVNVVGGSLRGVAGFGRPGRLRYRRGMGQSDDGTDDSGFIDTSDDSGDDLSDLGSGLSLSSDDGVSILSGSGLTSGLGDTLTSDDGLSSVDLGSLQNYVSDASSSTAPSTGSLTSLLTGSGLNLGQVVSVLGQYLNAGNVNTQQQQYLQAELAYAQQQAQLQVAQTALTSSSSSSSMLLLLGGGLALFFILKK